MFLEERKITVLDLHKQQTLRCPSHRVTQVRNTHMFFVELLPLLLHLQYILRKGRWVYTRKYNTKSLFKVKNQIILRRFLNDCWKIKLCAVPEAAAGGRRSPREARGEEVRGGEGRGAPRTGMRGGEGRGASKPALAAGAGALSGRKLRNKWLLFFPCWPSAGEFLSQWSISVDVGWQKGKFPNSVFFSSPPSTPF